MSERAHPQRRRLTPATRREQLLRAALEVFADRGYDGASIEAIAAHAGVTKPVIYRHFPSKADLHRAVLDAEGRVLLEAFERRGRGGTVEERFADALLAVFELNRAHPYAWRVLLARPSGDPVIAASQQAFRAAALGAVTDRFLTEPSFQPAAGIPRELAAEAHAQVVRAAVDGLLAWWIDHPAVDERELVAVAMDSLWSGLQAVANGSPWSARSA